MESKTASHTKIYRMKIVRRQVTERKWGKETSEKRQDLLLTLQIIAEIPHELYWPKINEKQKSR